MASKSSKTEIQLPPPFGVSPVPGRTAGDNRSQTKKGKATGKVTAVGRFKDASVQGDNAWKDMIRHEKLLIKFWNWNWSSLLKPPYNYPNLRCESREKEIENAGRKLGLIEYQNYKKPEIISNPSDPKIPIKSSEFIGWRSKDPKNSFDLYKTRSEKNPISKISFVKEQYGIYRKLKILQSLQKNEDRIVGNQLLTPSVSLPSKRIIHVVNPMLC